MNFLIEENELACTIVEGKKSKKLNPEGRLYLVLANAGLMSYLYDDSTMPDIPSTDAKKKYIDRYKEKYVDALYSAMLPVAMKYAKELGVSSSKVETILKGAISSSAESDNFHAYAKYDGVHWKKVVTNVVKIPPSKLWDMSDDYESEDEYDKMSEGLQRAINKFVKKIEKVAKKDRIQDYDVSDEE